VGNTNRVEKRGGGGKLDKTKGKKNPVVGELRVSTVIHKTNQEKRQFERKSHLVLPVNVKTVLSCLPTQGKVEQVWSTRTMNELLLFRYKTNGSCRLW